MSVGERAPRRRAIQPTGAERPFDLEEIFFSTTDRRGVITSGNDVFVRISGFELDELLGRAHNVVRHPDMPRGVFRLLWDHLEAGRPVAAYVQNLAADGSHYWVLAYVTPVEGGFLSLRIKPCTEYFDAARGLYERLRALEAEHEHDTSSRKAMIAASRDRLLEELQTLGFASYDEFMQTVVVAEVRGREHALQNQRRSHRRQVALNERRRALHQCDVRLGTILDRCIASTEPLREIAADTEACARLTADLHTHGSAMLQLSEDVEIFSLNAQIAANGLAENGLALVAVAGLLKDYSAQAAPVIERLSADIEEAVDLLGHAGDMGFATAVSRLQIEVLQEFVIELSRTCASGQSPERLTEDLRVLATSLSAGIQHLVATLAQLEALLTRVADGVTAVSRMMRRLRALNMNGRVESVRVPEAPELEQMFRSIGRQVQSAMERLNDFGSTDRVEYRNAYRLERLVDDITRHATSHGARRTAA